MRTRHLHSPARPVLDRRLALPFFTLPWLLAALLGAAFLTPTALLAHPAAEAMAGAASKFLAALTPDQLAKASFDFKADERFNWHFVPKERKGLTLKEMTAEQRVLALALLHTGLSEAGYSKATNIMSLESILAEMEGPGRRFPRDPLLYHFLIFGQPDPKGTWSWRAEGHHFSSSFTVVKGQFLASTPSFMGTNPAEVRQGARTGVRVLAGEEDRARELIHALDAGQRKTAILSNTAPADIFTEAKRRVTALAPVGVAARQMTRAQRTLLQQVIEEYVNRVRPDLAKEDLKKIRKAGFDKILFAWAGGMEKGEGHYYRVQGPTFLLEYDSTQNNKIGRASCRERV